MAKEKGYPNRSKVINRRKTLRRFNIKRIERNINLVQQRSMETISFPFFISKPLLKV